MKKLNRIFAIFVIFLIPGQARAYFPLITQPFAANESRMFGAFAYGGYGFGMMRVGSFKTFAESYNSFYGPSGQDILDTELKPFRNCSGYVFGGGIHIGPMSFSLSYVQMESSTEVDIKGGNKRVFTHVMRVPARIGIGFANKYLLAEFTTGFGTPYLKVGYQYYDGRISYGRERSLNGIYKSTCFTYGLNIAGKFPFAKVFALTAGVSVDGFSGFEYEDVNWNKIFWLGSPSYSQYMPSDVSVWNANPAAYPSEDAMMCSGFSLYAYGGLTIQLF